MIELELDAALVGGRFTGLAEGGPGRKILLVEIDGQPYRWSSHAFTTRPDDSEAPNVRYDPRVRPGFSVRRSLVNGTLLRGRSIPDRADISLVNVDGGLSALPAQALKGSTVRCRIGSDGWDLAEFRTVQVAILEEARPSKDGKTVELVLHSGERRLMKPLQADTFRGFGQAVLLTPSDDSRIVVRWSSAFQATDSLCIEAYVRFTDIGIAPHHIVQLGGDYSTDGGLALYNGRLEMRLFEEGAGDVQAFGETVLVAGRDYRLTGRWQGGQMQVFVDGVADGDEEAFAGPLSVVGTGASENLIIGDVGAVGLDGWITDIRLWVDVDRTDEQIYENRWKPLDPDDSEGLALYLETNEGVGDKTWDNTRGHLGALNGSASWISTKTGSKEQVGKPRPVSIGHIAHRDAVLVDQIDNWYEIHHRAVKSIDIVFAGGKQLVPDLSIVGSGVEALTTNFTFIDAADLTTPIPRYFFRRGLSTIDFRQYVPGQTVDVSGWGSTPPDGSYTVVAVDEWEGAWLEVLEVIVSYSITMDPVTFATPAPDVDVYLSPEDGTFQLRSPSQFPVTCRVRGDNVGGYVDTVPAMIARLATLYGGLTEGEISESFAEVEAELPGYVAGLALSTEPVELDAQISRLAVSIGATWGFTADTNLMDLRRVTAPPASPLPADVFELDPRNLLGVSRPRTVQPVKRTRVLFRHNFAPLTFDDLVGEVQEDQTEFGQQRLDLLIEEWSEFEYNPAGFAPGNLADELDTIESLLLFREHAAEIARQQHALYGVDREFFATTTKLGPYLLESRRGVVRLTHPNWLTTASGKVLRVIAVRGTRTRIEAEAWG